jgi:CarD family transcriptional regulator
MITLPDTPRHARFRLGAAVVHPRYGAGVVTGRQRCITGASRDYLEIRIEHEDMRVLVPEDAVDRVGLRSVMDDGMLSEVLGVLRETPLPVARPWNARHKSYRRRMADGDVLEIAALVRDLEGRSSYHNGLLSTIERQLLHNCRQQLVSELAVAMRLAPEAAEARLDSLVGHAAPLVGG